MSLKLAVDLSAYPKDMQLGINGLGVVKNGGTVDLTKAQEEQFYNERGEIIGVALKEQEGMTVTGTPEFVPPKSNDEVPVVETPTVVEKEGDE